MKFAVAKATPKNHGHTIDISKYLGRANEQILEVSASQSKPSCQSFEKTFWGWAGIHFHPPLPRPPSLYV